MSVPSLVSVVTPSTPRICTTYYRAYNIFVYYSLKAHPIPFYFNNMFAEIYTKLCIAGVCR